MTERLSILNENPRLLDGPKVLHELVHWESGSAPALEFLGPEGDDERWKYTYDELRKCVSSLAETLYETLSSSGSYLDGPQPIIPVLVAQSPALYISQLASLEVGGAFCPINLDAPKDRIKFIVGDVAAKVIIATRDCEENVTWEDGPTVIYVDEYFRIPDQESTSLRKSRIAKTDELAYVMYTSGSTGLPKGVGVSHRAATQSLLAHDLFIPPFQRFLQFAAPSFDVSVFEIFFPFFRGSTLVGCHRPRMLNDLPGTINAVEVDACELTPTVVGSLLLRRENVPKLKLLLTIGEMLTRPVVDEFGYSDTAEGLLYGMYGPTEAAIHCTANCNMQAGSKVGNIGVPFETVSCFIAAIPESTDASSEIKILPLGDVGELVLGGPQLADGYLNREKENKAAFMTFKGEPAYRTGDKGRMLEDGTIEVMGRISAGQVKLRGQRVELGEIEEVVYKQPGIKMAFASVLQGMLIVFASTKGQHVSLDDLMKTCEKWLPKYMVPSELVVMSEFPYLPSGKINKKKLEADYLSSRADDDQDDSQLSVTEKTVGKVLQDLLGFKVNAAKRLASYGLDSLMAIRLASLLRSSGFRITPVEILQAETLGAIARVCDEHQNLPEGNTQGTEDQFDFQDLSEPVSKFLAQQGITDDIDELLPCTPLQDAMLLETAVNSVAYNNSVELRIDGDFDEQLIRSALSDWAHHNPILRTGFVDCQSSYSAHTQVVWKGLSDSQISTVERDDFNSQNLTSLPTIRPLQVRIHRLESHYTLLINIHHALYDGWSLELLINDLESILSGKPLTPRPSFRHVVENNLRIASTDLWPQKQYWKDHLSQLDPQSIPNFQSLTNIPSGLDTLKYHTSISTADLEKAARALLISPQSLVQAAYAIILSSYLGKSDVCFGTVFSGRTASIDGIEDIAGPCLSTLPVRVDISTMATVEDVAQYLNSTVRKHLENDLLPLREIKKLSDIDAGRPIFDTLVIWQQTLLETDHRREKVNLVRSTDYLEFNLTLEITPGRETIRLDANYQQARFPRVQIDLLLRQIEQLVLSFIKTPKTLIDQSYIPLSDELLSVENAQPFADRSGKSLGAAVESIAAEDPSRPAIDYVRTNDDGSFHVERSTYAELNAKANQIAHLLEAKNVLPNDLVCICMDKSTELYVSILATIKAGAGYVPITTDTPLERIEYILQEAKVGILLTSSKTKEYLKEIKSVEIIAVDQIDCSQLSRENLPVKSVDDSLAYCVFTSGSTGMPKGVLVTTGSVLSNLETLNDLYPHSKDSRLLQSCSQGFDVSVFEIFWTWQIGGCLCSAVKDVIFRDIEALVRELKVTHLSLTATVAGLINPDNVPSVDVLICAGEAMTPKVFQAWAGRGLFNAYGPSETTNVVCVAENIKHEDVLRSIGKPLPTVSLFILAPQDYFQLVPRGGEGELCFGGPQVAKGYLNAAQNTGIFIDHPTYGRIYRTGDYGRLNTSGSVIFNGRKDDQIKIRGQRVELGEIDKTILDSAMVEDCITLVIEGDKEDDRRLITFWTAAHSSDTAFAILDPETSIIQGLYNSLSAALPIYMVPSALIPVSILPSTLIGKVDKALLKSHFNLLNVEQLDQYSNSDKTSVDHDWTELEQQIVPSVAQIAKVPEASIGPNTSFFALGIDSISAISLVRGLRDDAGLKVEISDILKHSSVARLAQYTLSRQEARSPIGPPTPEETTFDTEFLDTSFDIISKHGKRVERVLPCTPLQEAMLSASELSSGSAYKNQVTLDLKVSIQQFEDAWKHMVERHEILRTCFVKSGHARYAYAQIVLTQFDHQAKIIDGSAKSVAQILADQDSAEIQNQDLEPPYNLIYIQQQDTLKLVLSMHHALYDGFAMSVLYEEIERFLHDAKLEPAVSFAPFLRYMTGVKVDESDNYWKKLLHDFNPIPFSPAKVDGAAMGESNIIKISSESSLEWIEEQVKQHSFSLLSVCQAAWAASIAYQIEDVDVCFGNVVSGRTVPVDGLNQLVAPCFNTIPFRLRDLHKLSFMEAFRVLQSQNVNSLPYQLTALRRIQSQCSLEGTSVFDTLLLLQTPARDLDSSIWAVEDDSGTMDLPVVIEIVPHPAGNSLELTLHTHDSQLSEQEATEVLKRFDAFLKKSLQNPRAQILPADSKAEWAAKSQQRKDSKNRSEVTVEDDGNAWNELESKIRDIIAKFTTVPVEDIRKATSIYRLGLDSINAVQVATALRKEGHKVVASDVLQHPSIKELAVHIASLEAVTTIAIKEFDFAAFDEQYRAEIVSKMKAKTDDIESINPCTPVQCGMLAQTLHSGGTEYVNQFSMELVDGISLDKLRAAWESVMKKCEILRTGFVGIGNSKYPFVMVTYREEHASLPWNEIADVGASATVGMTPGELEHGPWRLEVLQKDSKSRIRFTAHHALYDAQSLELILSDVEAAYSRGIVPTCKSFQPVLSAILNSNEGDDKSRKGFWQDENKIFVNRFPDLTPLRETSTRSIARTIPSNLSLAKIEGLCMQQGVSVQAAGQAAWARLLSAYIGEPSVTFGVTLSGRSIVEDSDNVAFPTIVTLPVSCDVVGSNGELLKRTMSSNAKLHEHQFTPLTLIQRWSGHPEGKLFDTLFAYQKTTIRDQAADPLWHIVDEEASADFVVSIELLPTENGALMLQLTAKENVVPIEHADLMLKQFDALLADTLLNATSESSGIVLDDSNLLSITPPEYPTLSSPNMLLHDFVSRQAQLTPNKTALEFTTSLEPGNVKTESWTYAQFQGEVNKIAHLVQNLGAAQGQLIAVCFDKCPEASFAIVGIMKAGCAYVALDPNAPADRVKFIMEDSKATLVLTSGKPAESLASTFADGSIQVVNLGKADALRGCSTDGPVLSRPIDPQDASYCLYTSGTTGTPKGCELTHENAVQAMYAFQHLFDGHWTPESKWLQFASFHFDVSVLEQFWSWSVGICVASAPRDLIFEDIPGAIRQLGITHLDLTPSLARLLHPDEVPSLCKGVFITGGEQLKQEILDVWGEHACIYNGYGPTEATIGVTMYPRVPKNGKPANIGPQFLNVGSFVLKPGTSQPVLRGAVGELCVSGKLVGKGYLNRPDLTAERFPYLEDLRERVYRTGDLVRICHDGGFLFLGRADDQVKLRGQRLELTEITEVIKKNVAGLQEVVTLVLKHSKQQKEQLVTFYVPSAKPAEQQDPLSLISPMRTACTSHLPGYMVPTHFVPLKALPLSANNKADGKQLAKMYDDLSVEDLQKLGNAGQSGRAWTSAEQDVLPVLAEAMGVSPSDLTAGTNIFELGFDSISVIGLAQKLQRAGYENAKLAAVMKNSSIEALVGVLAADQGANSNGSGNGGQVAAQQKIAAFMHRHVQVVAEELDVESDAIEAVAPCTAAQAGMIYRFLDSEEALYFSSFDFELDAKVDLERLKKAWAEVMVYLEVLRMKFVLTSDGCAQVVLKEGEIPWTTVAVESSSEVEFCQAREAQHKSFKEMDKAEALANPYKISIIESGEKRTMALDIFHGLYDGVSLPLILRNVYEQYHGKENIEYGPSFLSVLSHGPLAAVEGSEDFWKETLETSDYSPMAELENGSPQDVTITRVVTGLEHLETLRQSLGVTYQAILQAAWTTVLQSHLSASASPTFGTIVSGRSIDFEDADKIVGPLLNTLAFHVDIEDGMLWTDLIQACHEFNIAVLPFQHTPLKDVQKWCGHGRDLFDTLFVFQRDEGGDEEVAALWREEEGTPVADVSMNGAVFITLLTRVTLQYPLAFEATLNGNGDIVLTIVGQGAFLSQEIAEGLLSRVEDAFTALKSSDGTITVLSNNAGLVKKGKTAKNTSTSTEESSIAHADFKWTQTSEEIRSQISSLSKVPEDSISPNTTLFSLGLDSIDVIKLASRLKKTGVKISVSALVKSQTIANMMSKITQQHEAPVQVKTSIQEFESRLRASLSKDGKLSEDAVAVLPATPLQEGMVAEMISSGYMRYLNHELYQVDKGVDMEKLKKAWETVVEEFDILRTAFVEVDDVEIDVGFAQVVHPATGDIWQAIELQQTSDLEEETKTIIGDAIESAKQGKLLQLVDISHGENKYYLLSISHALYDGWSLQALHADVQKAYNDQSITRPDTKATLEQLFNANGPEATKFWRTALSGLPKSEFPLHASSTTAVNRLERPSSISMESMQAFCRANNISLQTLGQTAWALLLASYLKRLDVAFGVVLSCRDTEEASELMFPLMNTVAVRSVIYGSLGEMLQYMQEGSNAMRAFQHFPLRKAQALAGNREGGLFDTLFIYQGKAKGEEVETKLYEAVESQSEVEFAVCVEMEVVGDELVWRTACRDAARTAVETEELLRDLDAVLARVVEDPTLSTIVSSQDGVSICGLPSFIDETSMAKSKDAAVKRPMQKSDVWTPTELTIRSILSQASKTPEADISHEHSIFHLGLDSISAIKLSSLLRRQSIYIGVNEIMKNNTIRAMADLISHRVDAPAQKEVQDVDAVVAASVAHLDRGQILRDAAIEEGNVQDIMPVAAGQLYMLSRWQESGGTLFAANFQYKIDGVVDEERLGKAWKALLARHAILRTVFIMLSDENVHALQVVLKETSNPVRYDSSAEATLSLLQPIFLVVEQAKEYQTISLRLHHALYDAVSLTLVIQDLETLYANPDATLQSTLSFKDFIARGIDAQSLQKQKSFWESYLPSIPQTPRPVQIPTGRKIEVFHPGVPIGNITSLAQKAGVTVDALILAAFAKAYNRRTTTNGGATIGLYLGNRSADADLSALAAPTLNLLPLHIKSVAEGLAEVAGEVQRDLQRVSARENVGASLAGIYAWTGTKVEVFVNLLKDSGDGEEGEERMEKGLFGESLSVLDMLRPRADVVDVVPDENLRGSFAEGDERLKSAYEVSQLLSGRGLGEQKLTVWQPLIDVELRLVDGGRGLDIGLFAPEHLLDLSGAEELVGGLRDVLNALE